ncbi:MAG: serine hydroxymethyltransferase [Candidatus Daviesbacteria bacterium]|nr:serine hydroxymethyltransferase [Candidatus Daviesbacteria bacterium]
MKTALKTTDPQIFQLVKKEEKRQKYGLEMIPSENYTSEAVMQVMGSILTNKYSEGYPRKRYYGGNEYIDQVELLAQERAKKLFGVPHANVQPYSGSPANFAVYVGVCKPGDTVMGLNLTDGGHLTHGWKSSITSLFYKSVPYHVKADGRVDMDEVRQLAKKHRPKLIWAGATCYPYKYEYEQYGEIADSVGAYFAADIAHVAGLIIAEVHPSPVKYAHIVTSTTHKTLRGPRGGIIMVTQNGLDKDPDLGNKIDAALFPGMQGGPHDHQTGAIAVALKEALKPSFKKYGQQVVKNSYALAEALKENGFQLVGNGSENHLSLIDLTPIFGSGGGYFVEFALGVAGITVNKQTIPHEPSSPYFPSGIRIGPPALTTRGMKESHMKKIAKWIKPAVDEVKDYRMPMDKEGRSEFLKEFKVKTVKNKTLIKISKEIEIFCAKFPVPGIK